MLEWGKQSKLEFHSIIVSPKLCRWDIQQNRLPGIDACTSTQVFELTCLACNNKGPWSFLRPKLSYGLSDSYHLRQITLFTNTLHCIHLYHDATEETNHLLHNSRDIEINGIRSPEGNTAETRRWSVTFREVNVQKLGSFTALNAYTNSLLR
jgi:hypothetical protein